MSRTITVADPQVPGSLEVLYKDPDAVLDYVVDWSTWLGVDTIATSAWTATGLTVDSSTNDDTTASAVLSGGSAGVRYTVTNRITTAGGLTNDQSFSLEGRES